MGLGFLGDEFLVRSHRTDASDTRIVLTGLQDGREHVVLPLPSWMDFEAVLPGDGRLNVFGEGGGRPFRFPLTADAG